MVAGVAGFRERGNAGDDLVAELEREATAIAAGKRTLETVRLQISAERAALGAQLRPAAVTPLPARKWK